MKFFRNFCAELWKQTKNIDYQKYNIYQKLYLSSILDIISCFFDGALIPNFLQTSFNPATVNLDNCFVFA